MGGRRLDRRVTRVLLSYLTLAAAWQPRTAPQARPFAVGRRHARPGAPRHCELARGMSSRSAGERAGASGCRRPGRPRGGERRLPLHLPLPLQLSVSTSPSHAPATSLQCHCTKVVPRLGAVPGPARCAGDSTCSPSRPRSAASLACNATPAPPKPPSNPVALAGLIKGARFLPPLAVFIHENACNSRVRFKPAPLAAAGGPAAMLRTPLKPLVCTPSQRQ